MKSKFKKIGNTLPIPEPHFKKLKMIGALLHALEGIPLKDIDIFYTQFFSKQSPSRLRASLRYPFFKDEQIDLSEYEREQLDKLNGEIDIFGNLKAKRTKNRIRFFAFCFQLPLSLSEREKSILKSINANKKTKQQKLKLQMEQDKELIYSIVNDLKSRGHKEKDIKKYINPELVVKARQFHRKIES